MRLRTRLRTRLAGPPDQRARGLPRPVWRPNKAGKRGYVPPKGARMNALPLIRRKLVAARIPDPYIHRQKLLTALSLGLEPSRRLTLVCGGPGYGKSTLVAAYLGELDVPACWYGLEDADADLTTFL